MNSTPNDWIYANEVMLMQMKTVLNDYLSSLKQKNIEDATISNYRSILEQFFKECTVPIDKLNSSDVLKWCQTYSIGKSEKALGLMFTALSSFFKYCIAEGYLDNMAVKSRWQISIQETLPKHFND